MTLDLVRCRRKKQFHTCVLTDLREHARAQAQAQSRALYKDWGLTHDPGSGEWTLQIPSHSFTPAQPFSPTRAFCSIQLTLEMASAIGNNRLVPLDISLFWDPSRKCAL